MMGDSVELVGAWLASNYNLTPDLSCRLLRSYTNDVYEVLHDYDRYILKLYGAGWRSKSEIRYEIALLKHLADKGVLVASGIEAKDGKILQQFGDRFAVLFEYAPGDKPQPPFTLPLYRAFGAAIAAMHEASNDFKTGWHREPLDLVHIIDRPLEQIIPMLAEQEQRDFLTHIADQVKTNIDQLAAQGLDWGPIHGDATLDNLHVRPDGHIILYDFDSGGPGWRAADLQGWAFNHAEYQGKWDAFKRGYTEVRPLQQTGLEAAPYLAVAWEIWGLKIDLDNRVLRQGPTKTREYLDAQLKNLKARLPMIPSL